MKKSIISLVTSLAVFSLAMTFSISAQPAHAQTVNCPAGYTCTPIATQPAGCPAGYTCTPVTVSSVTSTPPSTTSSCYSIPTNLYLGSTGNTVSSLQTWLMNNGFDISAISSGKTGTGYYGNQTAGALAKYLASQKYRNCNASPTSPTVPTQPTTPIQTTSQSCQSGQVWNGISCVAYSGAVTPIEILSPTSGQSVSQGSYLDISWQHGIDKAGQNVTLYIRLLGQDSLSGGAYTQIVQNIVNGQNLSVSISVPSDGDWKWLVPSTVQPGQYEIQIIESLVGTAGSPSDIVVSAPFTITASNGTVSQTCPAGQTWNASWGSCTVQVQQTSGQPYVKIISPDGGQTYSPGQVVPIQFSTNLTSQQAPTGFNIWAYYGGNSTNVGSYASGVQNIAMSYTGGTTYNWTVPSSLAAGNYVIYIVPATLASGVSNTGLFAFGNSYFTINAQTTQPPTCPSGQTWNGSTCVSPITTQPTVTITAPNGGTYQAGTSLSIQWTATGINSSNNSLGLAVYETSLGSTHSLLSTTISNTGSYNWTIPSSAPSGSDYVVYMSTSNMYAQSNLFTITSTSAITCPSGQAQSGSTCVPITVSVTSPTNGASYSTGGAIPISWTTNGPSNLTALIILGRSDDSANSGTPVTVKQVTAPNTGSYSLSIGSGGVNTLFPCPNGCTTNGSNVFSVRVLLETTGQPNGMSSGNFSISGPAATGPSASNETTTYGSMTSNQTGAVTQQFTFGFSVTAGSNPIFLSNAAGTVLSTSAAPTGITINGINISDNDTSGDGSSYFYIAPGQTKSFNAVYMASGMSSSAGVYGVNAINYGTSAGSVTGSSLASSDVTNGLKAVLFH